MELYLRSARSNDAITVSNLHTLLRKAYGSLTKPVGTMEVTKRFNVDEWKIENCQKMFDLYRLHDAVYKTRAEAFDW